MMPDLHLIFEDCKLIHIYAETFRNKLFCANIKNSTY